MSKEIEWIKGCIKLCLSEVGAEERVEEEKILAQLYKDFSVSERAYIGELFMQQFELNDRIYVLSSIVQYIKEKELDELLLRNILSGEFNCYVGSMLELQIARWVEKGYDLKVQIHRKNVQKFKKLLVPEYDYHPIEKRNKKRIVLITEQILSIKHAPTKMVLEIAYALQCDLGYEVFIFALPSNSGLPEDLWYKPISMNSNSDFRQYPLRVGYKDVIFSGYQIDMTDVSPKEYSMMMFLIHEMNPYFVFNIGVGNPIADLPGEFTTLVAMEVSTTCPVSQAEILVRLDHQSDDLENEYALVSDQWKQKQIFMEEKFPVIVEESLCPLTREAEHLPENRFLVAIVGNRLESEIDGDFIKVLEDIYMYDSRVAYVVIGDIGTVRNSLEKSAIKENTFYLGYRIDLMEVYGLMNLYLNPRRGGGGFSSAMALQAGLPVVTLPDCDVAYNVGNEFVVENYDEMSKIVCRYVSDDEFYKMKCEQAKLYKKQNTERKLISYVSDMMEKIIQVMEDRNDTV